MLSMLQLTGEWRVVGNTAPHDMFEQKCHTGMVQLLVDASPESPRIANNDCVTSLHFLCANKDIDDSVAVDMLGLLLEKHPEAVQRTESNGALPIHVACGLGKSPEFCHMLIEAYPGSERIAAGGQLPLHMSMNNGCVAVAKYLLKLYPESIDLANPDSGGYPIHYAVLGLNKRTNPATAAEIVQLLLDHDSNVALQKWGGRKFPLFTSFCMACNHRNNASIFNAAVKILHLF